MSYSFIKPVAKPFFTLFTKLWLILIIATVVVLYGANMVIKVRTLLAESDNTQRQLRYNELYSQIEDIKARSAEVLVRRDVAMGIGYTNAVLSKSVNNFFSIVPDAITLNEIFIDHGELTVRGTTPSKDAFNLLLEAPLRSVFTSTETTFFTMPNGWQNFVSVNKTEAGAIIKAPEDAQ